MNIMYKNVLIAVSDLKRSLAFYHDLFEQEVEIDLGWCVGLSGGFTLQLHYDKLLEIPEDEVQLTKTNDIELYFEVDDFDEFLMKLNSFPDIEYLTKPKTYDWKQRAVRIYDPDNHVIEVGESMVFIARRYLKQGYSVEETAGIIQHPVSFVETCVEK